VKLLGRTFNPWVVGSAVVDPALSNALRIWRNLWTDSDDLAVKAINFMKKRYS
jgi:D-psicose/D-tagatose/L-ribulose 3-epimerase